MGSLSARLVVNFELSAGPAAAQPPKLGLALSGGGFRAAFFHVGVLARLAETATLRKVEVISTVSGGSIVGALYYLALKDLLENVPDAEIRDEHYVQVVGASRRSLFDGVGRNLRARAYANLRDNVRMRRSRLLAQRPDRPSCTTSTSTAGVERPAVRHGAGAAAVRGADPDARARRPPDGRARGLPAAADNGRREAPRAGARAQRDVPQHRPQLALQGRGDGRGPALRATAGSSSTRTCGC